MNRNATFKMIASALSGRPARNVYFWILLLYTVHTLNLANERSDHYGITRSSWYWLVIGAGTLMQMLLVYTNNLVLVPNMLIRKCYLRYAASVFALALVVSACYTAGLKVANGHIDISNLQQAGMTTGPVTNDWSFASLWAETIMYLSGNLLWLMVFTMAWYMNDYARQREVTERALRRQAETELAFLRNQLSPHFLLNTLNNIYGLALRQSQDTPDRLLKLSSILTYLLYESDRPLAPIEREKEIMLAYIELELLRIKDREKIRFSITADRSCRIPPLLWLPQLENMFKHGTRIIGNELFADFRFSVTGNQLRIVTTNCYRPAAAVNGAKDGIGLQNLEKRLALLYPGNHRMQVRAAENIFTTDVSVTLP